MVSEMNRSQNWAKWANDFRLWISVPFSAVGLLGVILTISLQSSMVTIVCLVIFGINFLEVLGALSARVEIGQSSVRVYSLFKRFEIEFEEILGLKTERWDGGFYFIAIGPRWIKVLVVLTVDGEIELDSAFGTKKQIAKFEQALGKSLLPGQPVEDQGRDHEGHHPGGREGGK